MREILFRGKPKNKADYQLFSRTWKENCIDGFVYGSLIVSQDRYYICVSALCMASSLVNNGLTTMIEVIPETVGQYTGLTDKKIFQGDIVKATVIYNEMHRDSTRKVTRIYEVKYHEKFCYFYLARNKNNLLFDGNWSYSVVGFEVIGNIHDNPELLKGGVEE